MLTSLPHYSVTDKFTEVKVVVVFDAMMSGLPDHKEDFAGYIFVTLFSYYLLCANPGIFNCDLE